MSVSPEPVAVTVPEEETVATDADVDCQLVWLVTFCVVPLEKFAVAVNCEEAPIAGVVPLTLSSVSVSGTTPAIGASSQFTATANFSNGTTQNVTSQTSWQSTSASVATVSSSGTVTATGSGETDIRATYQSL